LEGQETLCHAVKEKKSSLRNSSQNKGKTSWFSFQVQKYGGQKFFRVPELHSMKRRGKGKGPENRLLKIKIAKTAVARRRRSREKIVTGGSIENGTGIPQVWKEIQLNKETHAARMRPSRKIRSKKNRKPKISCKKDSGKKWVIKLKKRRSRNTTTERGPNKRKNGGSGCQVWGKEVEQ